MTFFFKVPYKYAWFANEGHIIYLQLPKHSMYNEKSIFHFWRIWFVFLLLNYTPLKANLRVVCLQNLHWAILSQPLEFPYKEQKYEIMYLLLWEKM